MQRHRLFILLTLLLFCSAAAPADRRIADIRKEYQAVKSALATCKVSSVELDGYSTDGGEAKAYRDKAGNIRLIKVVLYGESGKVFEEYYYRNGTPFFVFYEHHRYNLPFNVSEETAKEMGVEPFDPKKTRITEDRYYFENGVMIKWLDEEKKDVPPQSKEFLEAAKEVTDLSNEMLAKFKPSIAGRSGRTK